ncbi:unnamed protein product [Pleuronectes platessa]|uniref:Uncharacterized protein n=1 Tax=Pleuronectes platessa TaxID=8262 RepID=A0A9N7VMS0_PLEPL|nr:unnamed protein product [Pleuronectes platessa]
MIDGRLHDEVKIEIADFTSGVSDYGIDCAQSASGCGPSLNGYLEVTVCREDSTGPSFEEAFLLTLLGEDCVHVELYRGVESNAEQLRKRGVGVDDICRIAAGSRGQSDWSLVPCRLLRLLDAPR